MPITLDGYEARLLEGIKGAKDYSIDKPTFVIEVLLGLLTRLLLSFFQCHTNLPLSRSPCQVASILYQGRLG